MTVEFTRLEGQHLLIHYLTPAKISKTSQYIDENFTYFFKFLSYLNLQFLILVKLLLNIGCFGLLYQHFEEIQKKFCWMRLDRNKDILTYESCNVLPKVILSKLLSYNKKILKHGVKWGVLNNFITTATCNR